MQPQTHTTDTNAKAAQFFPIWLSSLRLDTVTDFALYLRLQDDRPPVLYRERNLPFTEEARQRLLEHGTERAYVQAADERQYRRYVEENLNAILDDPAIETTVKSELVYQSASSLMDEVLSEPRAGSSIPRSRSLVQSTCRFLLRERRAFSALMRVTSYDYYTYTHSVNVFVFSVSLARRVGITDPVELAELGEGALLHDVGKSLIDPAIVNCRGRLDSLQWEEMKKHPVYGYDIVTGNGVDSPLILGVVRHHHEKLRGNGYPDGLGGGEIGLHARVTTIADIFDALTTQRSYKTALSSFPALGLMHAEMAADLDSDLFRAFVEMMGNPDAA